MHKLLNAYSHIHCAQGLSELLDEGAMQMLRDRGDDGNGTPLLAAVGQLQFEVRVHCLCIGLERSVVLTYIFCAACVLICVDCLICWFSSIESSVYIGGDVPFERRVRCGISHGSSGLHNRTLGERWLGRSRVCRKCGQIAWCVCV